MEKKIFLFLPLLVILFLGFWVYNKNQPGKLDNFTQCLKEKAIFYGAFWCPHCQSQKKLFGNSEKYLPYVECSTPNGKEQAQECQEKNIQTYPTWEFEDGSRESGELSLQILSGKTGCSLP